MIQPLPPVASGSGTTGRQGDRTPAAPLFGFGRSESNPAGIPYRRTARQSAAHLNTQSARRSEKATPFEELDVFSASRKGEASAIQMEPLRVSRRRESESFDWQLLSPFATEDVAYANLVPAITRALRKIQVKYDFPPAEVRRRYEKLDEDLASTDSAYVSVPLLYNSTVNRSFQKILDFGATGSISITIKARATLKTIR